MMWQCTSNSNMDDFMESITESKKSSDKETRLIAPFSGKKALVGAGALILFCPTLLYNVFMNKIQAEFRCWDQTDQAHGIDHLVIPTREYLFVPSFGAIN